MRLATLRPAGRVHQKKSDGFRTDFNRSSGCAATKGTFTQRRTSFLENVEALKRDLLSQRESRKRAQDRSAKTPVRPLTSFHDGPQYGGDLHRADTAWALHAAARGLTREQIEHEILNNRDLSKKGSASRRLAYAMRTASKAITLSAK